MATEETAGVEYIGLPMCYLSGLWFSRLPGSPLPFEEGAVEKLGLKA